MQVHDGRIGTIEKYHSDYNVTVDWYWDMHGKKIYPRKSTGVYFMNELEVLPLQLNMESLKQLYTELALATKDFNWLRELYGKEEAM